MLRPMPSLWLKRPRVVFLAILWTGCIFILSALPGKDLPQVDLWQSDKLVHALMYGIMCYLWARSISKPLFSALLGAVLISSCFGMAMEWMQETFFIDRSFDWMDVLANEIGVMLIPVFFRKRI